MKKKKKIKKAAKVSIYLVVVAISVVIGIVLYSVSNFKNEYKEEAIEKCKTLCKKEVASGRMLITGPCLSNEIADGWACDIVSNPRNKIIDKHPDNQCENHRNKTIRHLVELDPDCELVKAR